jgi:hypothetical protein
MKMVYGFMATWNHKGKQYAHSEDSGTSLEKITNSALYFLEKHEKTNEKVLCVFEIDLDTGDMKQLKNRAELEKLLDERREQEREDAREKSDYEEHSLSCAQLGLK